MMKEPEAGTSQECMGLAAKLTRRIEDAAGASVAAVATMFSDGKRPGVHTTDSLLHMPLNQLLYHVLIGAHRSDDELLQE